MEDYSERGKKPEGRLGRAVYGAAVQEAQNHAWFRAFATQEPDEVKRFVTKNRSLQGFIRRQQVENPGFSVDDFYTESNAFARGNEEGFRDRGIDEGGIKF